jgi:hypothetical protein
MRTIDKVVLITGASRGIGRELSMEMARRGMHVVAMARSRELLERLVHELPGGGHSHYPCDIVDWKCVESAVDSIVENYGRIDVLVNNAGVAAYGEFAERSLEELHWMVSVNLLGTINVTKAVVPHMVRRRSGSIVNVVSLAGLVPTPRLSVYSATKFALTALTNTLRIELRRYGVNVCGVYPGPVRDTDLVNGPGFPEDGGPLFRTNFVVKARDVVNAVVRCITEGKREVVVPGWMGPLVRLINLLGLYDTVGRIMGY